MGEREERGKRLADARKAKGLRQIEVAEAVIPPDSEDGVPRFQTVSEWERGLREPTVSELTALRELLDFGWDWYFTGRTGDAEATAFREIAGIVDRVRAATSAAADGKPAVFAREGAKTKKKPGPKRATGDA
jgi:transcriptional regulator with XRE-family HTH domain